MRLKEWVLANPKQIGLRHILGNEREYEFKSGDRAGLISVALIPITFVTFTGKMVRGVGFEPTNPFGTGS